MAVIFCLRTFQTEIEHRYERVKVIAADELKEHFLSSTCANSHVYQWYQLLIIARPRVVISMS